MIDTYTRQYEREEGRQEGRLEGWRDTMAQILPNLLQQRFSTMPDQISIDVSKLSIDELKDLLKSALSFTSPSDLENWLAERHTAS